MTLVPYLRGETPSAPAWTLWHRHIEGGSWTEVARAFSREGIEEEFRAGLSGWPVEVHPLDLVRLDGPAPGRVLGGLVQVEGPARSASYYTVDGDLGLRALQARRWPPVPEPPGTAWARAQATQAEPASAMSRLAEALLREVAERFTFEQAASWFEGWDTCTDPVHLVSALGGLLVPHGAVGAALACVRVAAPRVPRGLAAFEDAVAALDAWLGEGFRAVGDEDLAETMLQHATRAFNAVLRTGTGSEVFARRPAAYGAVMAVGSLCGAVASSERRQADWNEASTRQAVQAVREVVQGLLEDRVLPDPLSERSVQEAFVRDAVQAELRAAVRAAVPDRRVVGMLLLLEHGVTARSRR